MEVNISLWGYNDRYELGVGLWDVESEAERNRSEVRGRRHKKMRREEGRGGEGKGKMKEVTREEEDKSGKTCLQNALHLLRETQRKMIVTKRLFSSSSSSSAY